MNAPFEPSADDFRQVWAAFNGYGGLVDRPHSASMDEGYAEFDRWLAKVQAAAWDLGHYNGWRDRRDFPSRTGATNPYRIEDAA